MVPAARRFILGWMLLMPAVGIGGGTGSDAPLPELAARPWPEADRLFRGDSRWLGADDAHSVDLGNGRVLWLFGDTLIDPRGRGNRRHAAMVRNSIGIQDGYDPTTAEMTFFWRTSDQERPASFFHASGDSWYWPGDGARLGSRLLIFLTAVGTDPNPLGFALRGWRPVMVDRPDGRPDGWRMDDAITRPRRFDIILGTGGVIVQGGFVYVYGCDAAGSRAYLARWPAVDAGKGDLTGTQWWCGRVRGWLPEGHPQVSPAALFTDGQSEFGVYRDDRMQGYIQVQAIGFGAADLGFRIAARPEGPWSGLRRMYHPPEKTIPGVLIYAAKPHAFLTGNGCVVTYATNHMDPHQLIVETSLYFPRMLRVGWQTVPEAP